MKARKKPIIIECFEYDGDLINNDGEYYIPKWAVKAVGDGIMYYKEVNNISPSELFIKTLEGDMHVAVGDYVIKGVSGELYPCKPYIFKETYEIEEE